MRLILIIMTNLPQPAVIRPCGMEVMDQAKMSELERLVETLGNVSSACARLGVSRSLYYKWKARQPGGAGAGKRNHPQATREPVRARILEIAIQYPDWGCDRISYFLKLQKQLVSGTTVQKILRANSIGSILERKKKSP